MFAKFHIFMFLAIKVITVLLAAVIEIMKIINSIKEANQSFQTAT